MDKNYYMRTKLPTCGDFEANPMIHVFCVASWTCIFWSALNGSEESSHEHP